MTLSCLPVTYCITTDMLYCPLCHSIKIAMRLPHYHPRVGHYISVKFCCCLFFLLSNARQILHSQGTCLLDVLQAYNRLLKVDIL